MALTILWYPVQRQMLPSSQWRISVSLGLGFFVLTFSDFTPHSDFGPLSAFTILLALAGDLVLLPACLSVFRPRIPVPLAPAVDGGGLEPARENPT